MKVLVLASDGKERALIQGALEKAKHQAFSAATVAEALQIVETNRPRFAIVDDDIGSQPRAEFVARTRTPGHLPIYLLSLTSATENPPDADDTLRKPFTVGELISRVTLASRFLALGDSLSEAREQIENLAIFDPLTGVMNRNAFLRAAYGELERARRLSAPLSIIALDLDNFRDLNAAYGVAAGDAALKAVGATIRERCRPYDCIGRWTGDEFVVALPGVIGEDAEKIAGRIIKGVLSSEITYEGQPLTVGVSAGIASALKIHASMEVEPVIEHATQARSRAKEMGGNQVFLTYL